MKKVSAYAGANARHRARGQVHLPLKETEQRRVARTCTIGSHESWEEHPGAVPILSVHDEIVVECSVEQAEAAKAWLEKAMVEGMNAILNDVSKSLVPVEVESRIVNAWGES